MVWDEWDDSKFKPLQVEVSGDVEAAIKKFCKMTVQVPKQVRAMSEYLKPSVKKRKKRMEAKKMRKKEQE